MSDKSVVVEDTNNGRIFYLNKNGDVVWEFNNINEKGLLYSLFWSSIIKGEKLIEIKEIIKNKGKICKK